MREKIIETLNGIAEQERVKILFAVEAGSRAWGMDSVDSDYDVRFVYIRTTKEYLSLRVPSDQIEFQDKENKLDIVGFDVYKFLRLLSKSNPSCIEWLGSPISYREDDFRKDCIDLIVKEFNPTALFYHYRSLAKQNFEKYIRESPDAPLKKYLYCMRGLCCARYVEQQDALPPVSFPILLQVVDVPHKEMLKHMILVKQKVAELEHAKFSLTFAYEFIQNELNRKIQVPEHEEDLSKFNELLFNRLTVKP